MVPDAAADDLGGLMLHQFFTLVATLHTHIFVFDLVDFSVSEQQCFDSGRLAGFGFRLGGPLSCCSNRRVDFALPLAAS